MALYVGLLLVWACWHLSAASHLLFLEEDVSIPTVDGKCFFPFYYKNQVFYDCIKFKAKHKWCSLNDTYEGYWKYCSEEDLAKCVFPFWYRRMIYWECTDDSDGFGKKWCSLTQDYNKEKVWKYCDL
ncbi:PREDICTED: binder of sperm protein homolog 1-like isoform X2 [Hipposideros armiger]|uniref:Binder of sperm protein homolog 1-like isoform X2 n=1 Tax=Hipposideros armiger TaxID=186990 RepID=A0A8B7SM45_HIPAR|nr:PREDICTED: binder of sperm protein homolog 1-like isoform X2 [Hipposideros armiger]